MQNKNPFFLVRFPSKTHPRLFGFDKCFEPKKARQDSPGPKWIVLMLKGHWHYRLFLCFGESGDVSFQF